MIIKLGEEFQNVCSQIINENKNDAQWCFVESSDMFQTEHYSGGYDACEQSFCFSYYNEEGKEFWFQVNLQTIKKIIEGRIISIEGREVSS